MVTGNMGNSDHKQSNNAPRRTCVPSTLVSLALRPRRMTPACIKAWTASLNPAAVWHCWIATGADIQAMAVKTSACTTEHYPLHRTYSLLQGAITARCGQTNAYCWIDMVTGKIGNSTSPQRGKQRATCKHVSPLLQSALHCGRSG